MNQKESFCRQESETIIQWKRDSSHDFWWLALNSSHVE